MNPQNPIDPNSQLPVPPPTLIPPVPVQPVAVSSDVNITQNPISQPQPTQVAPSVQPAINTPVGPQRPIAVSQPIVMSVQPIQPQQPIVDNQVIQQPGFSPAGFQQANFMQQGFQPGDIKSSKKGLINNKLFILFTALAVFGLVIGGWFAYSRLWVVNRAPSLISYQNTSSAYSKVKGNIYERTNPSLSSLNADYSSDVEKTRHENTLALFEKLDEFLVNYESEATKFNKLRDPEFAVLLTDSAKDTKECSVYMKNLNSDLNVIGPEVESLRKTVKSITSFEQPYKDAKQAKRLKLLSSAKQEYQTLADNLTGLDIKTSQVKQIRDAYVKKLQSKEIDKVIKEVKNPDTYIFASTYNSTNFYDDTYKKANAAINNELEKGVCWSEARDKLREIYNEYDFSESEKNLLESVELF